MADRCKVCGRLIHAQRRAASPRAVTCSSACSKEHARALSRKSALRASLRRALGRALAMRDGGGRFERRREGACRVRTVAALMARHGMQPDPRAAGCNGSPTDGARLEGERHARSLGFVEGE